jgi:hypothetical protein
MRDFFCSLASTNLVHSCLIFQLFCNGIEVNTLAGGCKDAEFTTETQSHRVETGAVILL